MNNSDNLKIITNLVNTLTDEQIDTICDLISNPPKKFLQELIKSTNLKIGTQISNIIKYSYYKKYTELEKWINSNLIDIKFNFVEDWKNQKKINLTKLLIVLEYLDNDSLHKNIGGESKKTYANKEVINDASLSLKKCFDSEFKSITDEFYSNLDLVRIEIINLGINEDLVKNLTKQMVTLIQCEIVCRRKYDSGELINYTEKIKDITDTRLKEKRFYQLANKIRFNNLVNEPEHLALKILLHGSWDETKQNYKWLTDLITFINNGSPDAKECLITNCGIPDFDDTDKRYRSTLIRQVAENSGLNMKYSSHIINYIFSLGIYHKHGTYFKWYNKEYEHIQEFEQYKAKTFDENLLLLVNQIGLDIDLEPIQKLIKLMEEYKNIFYNNFS